jgi:carbon starvation protein
MGENTLFSRTGGAPSLALGMASIFSSAFGGKFGSNMLAMWYHFAIMFEAIFILTTLDAGTRVARFMLQDMLGNICKPLGNNSSIFSAIFSSFLIVSAWGYFLYLGVIDPSGGVNILWPLFGMSNQMLAGIAMLLATVLIAKSNKRKYVFITAIPLIFLLFVTSAAVLEKVFSLNEKIGFLAVAKNLQEKINSHLIDADKIELTQSLIFNQKLLTFIALSFMAILWIVTIDGVRRIIRGK